jgi:hypothetical protein
MVLAIIPRVKLFGNENYAALTMDDFMGWKSRFLGREARSKQYATWVL